MSRRGFHALCLLSMITGASQDSTVNTFQQTSALPLKMPFVQMDDVAPEMVEKPVRQFLLPEDEWPQCVAFTPDQRRVVAGTTKGNFWVWELNSKQAPKVIRMTSGGLLTGAVECVAISSDGRRALVGCADYGIRVVDMDAFKVTSILKGHHGPVFSVILSKDNKHCFSGSSGDRKIYQWDLQTGKPIRRFDGKEMVSGLAVSSDGKRLLSTEFTSVQEWNANTGERLRTFDGHRWRIYGVFYSPDDNTIISGDSDTIRVWDNRTGECLKRLNKVSHINEHFALSTNGRLLLKGGLREMQLFDLKAGIRLKHWETFSGFVRVAFSPDGRYALSGDERGISLWKLPAD